MEENKVAQDWTKLPNCPCKMYRCNRIIGEPCPCPCHSSAPNVPDVTRLSGEQAEERTAREGWWHKWLAWVILSPLLIVLSPIWIPSYALLWALNEVGFFDGGQEVEIQRIANAQYEAAKKTAENSYKPSETR